MNINQVLIIGKLLISNENKNSRNIICNVQGWRTGIFVVIGETNDQSWI